MPVKLLNIKYSKFKKTLPLALTVLAILFVVYFPNYAKLRRLRQTNEELLSKIATVENEIKDLEQKLEKLGKDPSIYESIAREDLGVARQNEIVVDIEE